MMTKRNENKKIKKLEKKWAKDATWFNNGLKDVFRRVKGFLNEEMEGMMYGKRPKDIADRIEHAFWWWLKLLIILFALKYLRII